MGTGIVLELDALADDQAADDVVSYAVVHGHTGVVVKGSQGTRWVRENAAELLSDAQSEGYRARGCTTRSRQPTRGPTRRRRSSRPWARFRSGSAYGSRYRRA